MDQVKRYDDLRLRNEHGDFFLLHNFGVQIVPFKLAKKIDPREKKIWLKASTKPVTR